MKAFLVPIGTDRYELYCEEPDEAPSVEAPPGFFSRLVHRFRVMVAEADQERRAAPAAPPRTFAGRIKARTLRWVAEAIAEQRLLWQLRRRTEAALLYPEDLPEAHAREILRRQLNRDFESHRFWLAIDSLGLVASALLVLVPGPNLVAYYFAFRIVGHYLSVRGARQGLVKCTWTLESNAPLAVLRHLVHVAPAERDAEVRDIASRLCLEHFAQFFQRIAA
jgi:hypothetical protein